MGSVNAKPTTSKTGDILTLCDNEVQVTISACSMQGWRKYQEDRYSIHLYRHPRLESDPITFTLILSLFDGHGGAHTAEACRRLWGPYLLSRLHPELQDNCDIHTAAALYGKGNAIPPSLLSEESIRATFLHFDSAVLRSKQHHTCGSTATVAVLDTRLRKLVVAHIGDSRAIVFTPLRSPLFISKDHAPDCPIEAARIAAAGLRVHQGRVLFRDVSSLNLSRSFGDKNYKGNANIDPADQAVTADPAYWECDYAYRRALDMFQADSTPASLEEPRDKQLACAQCYCRTTHVHSTARGRRRRPSTYRYPWSSRAAFRKPAHSLRVRAEEHMARVELCVDGGADTDVRGCICACHTAGEEHTDAEDESAASDAESVATHAREEEDDEDGLRTVRVVRATSSVSLAEDACAALQLNTAVADVALVADGAGVEEAVLAVNDAVLVAEKAGVVTAAMQEERMATATTTAEDATAEVPAPLMGSAAETTAADVADSSASWRGLRKARSVVLEPGASVADVAQVHAQLTSSPHAAADSADSVCDVNSQRDAEHPPAAEVYTHVTGDATDDALAACTSGLRRSDTLVLPSNASEGDDELDDAQRRLSSDDLVLLMASDGVWNGAYPHNSFPVQVPNDICAQVQHAVESALCSDAFLRYSASLQAYYAQHIALPYHTLCAPYPAPVGTRTSGIPTKLVSHVALLSHATEDAVAQRHWHLSALLWYAAHVHPLLTRRTLTDEPAPIALAPAMTPLTSVEPLEEPHVDLPALLRTCFEEYFTNLSYYYTRREPSLEEDPFQPYVYRGEGDDRPIPTREGCIPPPPCVPPSRAELDALLPVESFFPAQGATPLAAASAQLCARTLDALIAQSTRGRGSTDNMTAMIVVIRPRRMPVAGTLPVRVCTDVTEQSSASMTRSSSPARPPAEAVDAASDPACANEVGKANAVEGLLSSATEASDEGASTDVVVTVPPVLEELSARPLVVPGALSELRPMPRYVHGGVDHQHHTHERERSREPRGKRGLESEDEGPKTKRSK